jgi:predicted PurR-regulated permease PerM
MTHNGPPPSNSSTDPTPAIVQHEGPLATGERLRPYALAVLTLALVALCVWLAWPFLPAITWGVALAVIAWPLQTWILRRLIANRTWAAGLATLAVVLAVVVPGVFVVREVGREAASAADQMKEEQAKNIVRERMVHTPGLEGVVRWADRTGIDLDAEVRKAVQSFFGDPAALAQGSVAALLQAVIAVFIIFYMLRDRAELLAGVRRVLPMRRAEIDRVFTDAAGSVYANLYATLVTSAIDGLGLGLMFWLVGLPSPVTWGVVTFVLSFLPILGTYLVWMPAAIYLMLAGQWGGALAIIVYGVVTWGIVDNVIYVRIAGDKMRIHQIPTLIAFLGGLVVFGASGMILGPGILAVTVAVLDVWHHRAAGEAVPKSAAEEPDATPERAEPTPGGIPRLAPSS